MTTRVGCSTHLADTNSLVSVFGGEDRSFRYHTLLRGYLVARLADLSGQRSRAQHLRIAHFLHARGDDAEALDHAIASRDRATLFTLLHDGGLRLLLEGRHAVVDRAVAHLLEGLRDEQPRRRFLHILAAIVALDAGDLPRAEAHLEAAGGRGPAAGPSAVAPVHLDRLCRRRLALPRPAVRRARPVGRRLGARGGEPARRLRPPGPGRPQGLRAHDRRHRPALDRSLRRRRGRARRPPSSTPRCAATSSSS